MELHADHPLDKRRVRPQPLKHLFLVAQTLPRLDEPAVVRGLDLLQLAELVMGVLEKDHASRAQARKQQHVEAQDDSAKFHGSFTWINSGPSQVRNSFSGPGRRAGFGVRFRTVPAYSNAHMYQSYYGFKEMPFNITPDPKFLFLSPTHQEALQHLKFGVRERKGFIVLIGEVGCGKTTLCRRFLNELDPGRFDTALILNPRVTETQMLKAILHELGETKLARSQVDLVSQMNRVLLERIGRGRDIELIIDEAQNLSFEVLEQVRLLSNLETDKQKLLQIVLMGQPELKDVLARSELRQLRQRILVHYELHPLSQRDMIRYIQHRLTLAGGAGRPSFTAWALRAIHKSSRGIPRVVNTLCDKAMLSAFIRESDEVNYWDARRAARDMENLTN
jgi:general secretion pathway protein A